VSTLERAIEIAALAHAGQTRFDGEPYILHPLRVMLQLETADERIAAVLHDVVEKSDDWPLERLWSEGFPGAVLRAVEALSRRPDEDEAAFVRRAASDPIGHAVKRADLLDNIKAAEKSPVSEERQRRLDKYRRELRELEPALVA
jgi:(p)ppGpp synthase/HD superfamily hydrolase